MHQGTHEPSVAGFSYIIADDYPSVMIAVSHMLADLQGGGLALHRDQLGYLTKPIDYMKLLALLENGW